jgi:hypothetical protein
LGRNTRNKIRNGNFKNRNFNIENIRKFVEKTQRSQEAVTVLGLILLVLPWAALFASGFIISPVYAQGGADVSTDLDTMVFFAVGVGVFILVVVFAVILKGKGKKIK